MKKVIAKVNQMRKKRSKRDNLLQNKKRKNRLNKSFQRNNQKKRKKKLKNTLNKQIIMEK